MCRYDMSEPTFSHASSLSTAFLSNLCVNTNSAAVAEVSCLLNQTCPVGGWEVLQIWQRPAPGSNRIQSK